MFDLLLIGSMNVRVPERQLLAMISLVGTQRANTVRAVFDEVCHTIIKISSCSANGR